MNLGCWVHYGVWEYFFCEFLFLRSQNYQDQVRSLNRLEVPHFPSLGTDQSPLPHLASSAGPDCGLLTWVVENSSLLSPGVGLNQKTGLPLDLQTSQTLLDFFS